jgi:prolyl-tRNA synthetase
MRAREFLMKDAYSFDIDAAGALISYEAMFRAYVRIFQRLDLKAIAVKADTGAMGGDLSHEFHVLADSGESTIYYEKTLEEYMCQEEFSITDFNTFYANEETQHLEADCRLEEHELAVRKGIEIGHIFYLGDKYTKSLDFKVQDRDGELVHPQMGCYGIGVSRIVAAIIEAKHDDEGIVWPKSVTPFDVMINNLRVGDEACDSAVTEVAQQLSAAGRSVLVDDTTASMSEKLTRSKLLGFPWIINIGPRSIAAGKLELVERSTLRMQEIGIKETIAIINGKNKYIG